jgi:hypothetical protein
MSIAPDIMVHPRPALAPANGNAPGKPIGTSSPESAQPRAEKPEAPAWMRDQMPSGEADAHGFRDPNGEDQELGFFDFLDVINPLQHLPVIGSAYRQITGDQISPAALAAGGFLWGGPTGLLAGAMNSAMLEDTGQDVMGNVVAWLENESPADLAQIQDRSDVLNAADAADAQIANDGVQTAATDPQTNFQGAAASRLDAFIRANGNPSASAASGASSVQASGLSPAAMEALMIRQSLRLDVDTANLRGGKNAKPSAEAIDNLANRTPVSGPATAPGSVGSWMTQALDQYDTLQSNQITGKASGQT